MTALPRTPPDPAVVAGPIERDMSGPAPHPPHVIHLPRGKIIPMGAWDPLPPLPTAEEITAELIEKYGYPGMP